MIQVLLDEKERRKENIHLLISLIVFLLVSIIYATPLFKNINNWGQMDWDQFIFWNAVPRETILRYHQFPLWNPYSNGGNAMLALPHSSFLSPFFILVLLFGPVVGLKIQWIICIFLGMVGMFFLGRYFKLKKISQYLPPGIFMLSSHFTLHLSEGHAEWMTMAFLPWFFLFVLKAHLAKKYFSLAVFFLASMILGGGIYVSCITVVFTTVYFLLLSIKEKKAKYILSLLIIYLCAYLACAVKLVPMLEFLKDNSRRIESNEKTAVFLLPSILLLREQNLLYQNTKWTNPKQRIKFRGKEFEYGWHEYGAYVGIAPLVLAIIGVLFYFKQYWPLLAMGILSLWVSLGKGVFYNLWGLLHKLPVYDSLHVPSRFILIFIYFVSIFAGLGLSKLKDVINRRYHKVLISIIVGAIFLDLLLVNYPLLKNIFTIRPLEVKRYAEFKQRYRVCNLFPQQSRSSMYPIFLSDSGIINSYEVIGVKRGDVKTVQDNDYKGETYLMGTKGDASMTYFSPNRIVVNIKAEGDGILVLNQNYYTGWRVLKHKEWTLANSFNGLISTLINSSDKTVTFYYFPASFLIGVSVTLVTVIAGVIFFILL